MSGVTALSFYLENYIYKNHLSCFGRTRTNYPGQDWLLTALLESLDKIRPNTVSFVFSDQWTMWEGGSTLNRLTQAPPLRSARIQRLSSRSWLPRTPSFDIHNLKPPLTSPFTLISHNLQPIVSLLSTVPQPLPPCHCILQNLSTCNRVDVHREMTD